jgi:catechol 2,3-dioxygenase
MPVHAHADGLARLATAVEALPDTGHWLQGATDHGVNIAVYLRDPDGNGVELMVGRPDAEWPRGKDGGIAMRVDPLDLTGLLADAFEIDSRAPGG